MSNYTQLTEMVKEDFQGQKCFSVGLDHIGGFWESSGEWTYGSNYQNKLTLEQVLEDVSITPNRYDSYINLFKATNTERITHCQPEKFYLLAYRSGLAVSGCSAEYVKSSGEIPIYRGKRNNGEDFTEIYKLANGWYIEYSCT
ncbi:hypothetical protein [Aliikangiella maris]